VVGSYKNLTEGRKEKMGAPSLKVGRKSEFFSLIVFALGVFTFISIVTYDAADPSWFTSTGKTAQNACGAFGAMLAAILLQTLGVGAFLVPAALLFMAITLLQKDGWVRFFAIMSGMGVALVSLTVFLGLQWRYWPYGGELLLTAGAVGEWLMNGLQRPLNPLGASLLSAVVFLGACVICCSA